MALRFADSCSHYTNAQGTLKWTAYSVGSIVAGPWGAGSSALSFSSPTHGVQRTVPGLATYTAGVRAYVTTLNRGGLISFLDGGTLHLTVAMIDGTGRLGIYRGNPDGGTLLASSTVSVPPSVWTYIEAKATIDDTVGAVEVRMNGVAVIVLANVDTRNAGSALANSIGFGYLYGNSYGMVWLGTDFYIADASGGVNDSFLGDVRVQALLPTGAGATTTWTPNGGANWDRVDDATPDDDTTYISATAAGTVDTYTMADLTTPAGLVRGIQYCIDARKDDAGSRTVAPVVRTGAVDYVVGAGQSLGASYGLLLEPQDTNPGTAAAWTIAEVNAVEAGAKLVA